VVGVLATPATFQGALYASVVERFASGVTVLQDTCPGLVTQIERGNLAGDETRQILEKALTPMLSRGADTVVLGCTHYPFVIPLIREIGGEALRVIDPAPAVARQIQRVLASRRLEAEASSPPQFTFYTSGSPAAFDAFLSLLLGETGLAQPAVWQKNSDGQETIATI